MIEPLLKHARKNSIKAERLDEQGVRQIEPRDAAVMDSKAVVLKLQELLVSEGIKIFFTPLYPPNTEVRKVIPPYWRVWLNYLFNCTGAYIDKVAKHFGLVRLCTCHLHLRESTSSYALSECIWYTPTSTIPDVDQPFLGAHLTRGMCIRTQLPYTGLVREN